jgi:hypothetical protein
VCLAEDPHILGAQDLCIPGERYTLFCTIVFVSALVPYLMAANRAARVMKTFLEGAVFIIQARYICDGMCVRRLQ